jgi:DNA repair exonuclease SbcCD ATPase subunit
MKIIQLTAENVKRIKAVTITPDGNFVQVTGKNGEGKTSVLDSIWWGLAGSKNIQAVPIRKGEEQARIRLDMGKIIVERKFTAKGTTTLTVRNAEGAEPGTPDKKLPKWGAPHELLRDMLGELTFDPLKFARMEPADQFEQLRKISKLSVDIDALDAANKIDYDKRTDLNRDAKDFRSQAAGIDIPENLPESEIDEGRLLNEIQEAGEHNANIETRKLRREQAEEDIKRQHAEIIRIRKEASDQKLMTERRIDLLKVQISDLEKDLVTEEASTKQKIKAVEDAANLLKKNLKEAPPLPEPILVADLRSKLEAAKEVNEGISGRDHRDSLNHQAGILEKRASELTAQMKHRQKKKQEAIQAAEMPVKGLGFGQGFITFNELPFDQASDSEQLRVSVAIAMSANPEIRIIRIRDGSLLDEDSLKIITEMADENDYQVWLERVDSSGEIGIVMEDGEVKES